MSTAVNVGTNWRLHEWVAYVENQDTNVIRQLSVASRVQHHLYDHVHTQAPCLRMCVCVHV